MGRGSGGLLALWPPTHLCCSDPHPFLVARMVQRCEGPRPGDWCLVPPFPFAPARICPQVALTAPGDHPAIPIPRATPYGDPLQRHSKLAHPLKVLWMQSTPTSGYTEDGGRVPLLRQSRALQRLTSGQHGLCKCWGSGIIIFAPVLKHDLRKLLRRVNYCIYQISALFLCLPSRCPQDSSSAIAFLSEELILAIL